MRAITVRPYQHGDLAKALPTITAPPGGLDGHLVSGGAISVTGTGEDGEIVLCCGLLPLGDGHKEAWLAITPWTARRYIAALRVVREQLTLHSAGLRRVSARCDDADPAAARILEHLGFKLEGVSPGFGPLGETFRHYGLLLGAD